MDCSVNGQVTVRNVANFSVIIKGELRYLSFLRTIVSSKWRLYHIIKKYRFKMAAVVGLSTSRSEYFVGKECMLFAWFK